MLIWLFIYIYPQLKTCSFLWQIYRSRLDGSTTSESAAAEQSNLTRWVLKTWVKIPWKAAFRGRNKSVFFQFVFEFQFQEMIAEWNKHVKCTDWSRTYAFLSFVGFGLSAGTFAKKCQELIQSPTSNTVKKCSRFGVCMPEIRQI